MSETLETNEMELQGAEVEHVGEEIKERGKIVVIIGWRGDGKTAFMTYLAGMSHDAGVPIYANYDLYFPGFVNKPVFEGGNHTSLEEASELPEWLHACDVFLDEVQEGADSRAIFKSSNKGLSKLTSQLRKRQINLFATTQNWKKLDIRIRRETDYVLEVQQTLPDFSQITIWDMRTELPEDRKYFYLPIVYGLYDTYELISQSRGG